MKIEIKARAIFRNFLLFVLLPISVVSIVIFFLTAGAPGPSSVDVIFVASVTGAGFCVLYPTLLAAYLIAVIIEALATDRVYTIGKDKTDTLPKATVSKL